MTTETAQPIKMFPIKLSKREKKSHKLVAQYKHRIGLRGPQPPKREDSLKSEKERVQEARAKRNAQLRKEKLKPKEKADKAASPEKAAKANSLLRAHWNKGNRVIVNALSTLFNSDGEIKNNAVLEGTVDKSQPMNGDTGVVIQTKNQTWITVDFNLDKLTLEDGPTGKKVWTEKKKEDKDEHKGIWDIHYSAITPNTQS